MNWLREIWKLRPPVSPWWMYRWLEDTNGIAGSQWSALSRWRKIAHSLSCWWLLWHWAASPAGYGGDYEDVKFGAAPQGETE